VSENEYWALVRELVTDGHEAGQTKRDLSEKIAHLVQTADAAEEPWAADVLTRWIVAGAGDDYSKVFKDQNHVTYIRADGTRTKRTVGYSRPQRSKETGAVVGWQMQAWWFMSRAAIEELRLELLGQGVRLADVVAALDLILSAMDRHPKAKTACEAWLADGHSVDEIDLALPDVAA
jgi:hypothetical protein